MRRYTVFGMLALALACLSILLPSPHHNVVKAQQPTPTPNWSECPQGGDLPDGVMLRAQSSPPFGRCVIATGNIANIYDAFPEGEIGLVCLYPKDGWRVLLFDQPYFGGNSFPVHGDCVTKDQWGGFEVKSIQIHQVLPGSTPVLLPKLKIFLPVVSRLGSPFGPPGPGCVWDEVKRAWDCLIPSEPTRTSTPENILTPPDATATP